MNLGLPEIIIIIAVIVVLFGLFRFFGDKRNWKRPGKTGGSSNDNKGGGGTGV